MSDLVSGEPNKKNNLVLIRIGHSCPIDNPHLDGEVSYLDHLSNFIKLSDGPNNIEHNSTSLSPESIISKSPSPNNSGPLTHQETLPQNQCSSSKLKVQLNALSVEH